MSLSGEAHGSGTEYGTVGCDKKRLGQMQPRDCIVVGDSPYDAEAAAKAGIRSVGFLCGGFPEADLRGAGFESLYEGAADLLANHEGSVFFKERPTPSEA